MIPRVSRGHSFKGAGLYYLHDKREEKSTRPTTDKRVDWTYTHNLPTDDAQKAMGYMAYTAMNANAIKRQAGVSASGRKNTAGAVYTFALAWPPEEKPEPEHMRTTALSALEALGLIEHESVMVAHNDTEHRHVHIISNLVHPETGKTANLSHDYLALSEWAENYERHHGKIHCPQRVENNRLRAEQAKEGKQRGMVKYREQQAEQAEKIAQLYHQSDSGKAFVAALQQEGYALAKGDRRGVVVIDQEGKVCGGLARQIKGQTTADVNARLGEVLQHLPSVAEASHRQQHFDREHYEAQRQQQLEEAAIQQDIEKRADDVKNRAGEKKNKKGGVEQGGDNDVGEKKKYPENESERFLRELDTKRELEQQAQRRRWALEEQQEKHYQRQKTVEKLEALKQQLQQHDTPIGRLSKAFARKQEAITALEKNLENIDLRIAEQNHALENKIEKELMQNTNEEQEAIEKKKENRVEELKQKWRKHDNSQSQDNHLTP